MYERSSSLVLRWLKVPAEPQPPIGNPASLRVFRAGKNYFNLRLASWAFGQVVALAGIIFWLVMFIEIEGIVDLRRKSQQGELEPITAKNFSAYLRGIEAQQNPPESPVVQATTPGAENSVASAAPARKQKRPHLPLNGWAGFKQLAAEIALRLPPWTFPVLWGLKLLGFLIYVVQVPFTYALRRLDYEMRWYMVTDRSLRIRHGVWKVSESTMSFANIQQVVVSQGPLQRLLGLSNVKVQSAGGGSGGNEHQPGRGDDDMHLGLFFSVTNGSEIRDLILERLRQFRESGLGDPDEKPVLHATTAFPDRTSGDDAVAAARELLVEAKALRAAVARVR